MEAHRPTPPTPGESHDERAGTETAFIEALARLAPPGPILDLASPGLVAATELAALGRKVLRVVPEEGAGARGALPEGVSRVHGDPGNPGLPQSSMSGVLASTTLLPLADTELDDALGEIARMLTPGGIAVLGFTMSHAGQHPRRVGCWSGYHDAAARARDAGLDVSLRYARTRMPGAGASWERALLLARRLATVPSDCRVQRMRGGAPE